MESVFGRYRNLYILLGVLFLQVIGLAMQIRRTVDNEPTRLIRVWTVSAVTPFEKAIVWAQSGTASLWHNYFYLRGVRQENRDLKAEVERLRIEQVRLNEDAGQARRLQVLLGFKEQFISKTIAAQVIGSSGSEKSRSIYIDKGWRDGIRPDMAVVTADGVVGKVLQVYGQRSLEASTAQVLLINDQSSGVGAILEKSRLQGILKGSDSGEVILEKVMSDEEVQPGDRVLTSGGDQIFPKGLPLGTVMAATPGKELFLNIKIKPAANLSRLEEVLVITKLEEKTPNLADNGSMRAIDILAQRLPSVPDKPAEDPNKTTPGTPTAPAAKPQNPAKPNDALAGGQPPATKPAEKAPVKPSGIPLVKPATEQNPAPPAVRVLTPLGSDSTVRPVPKTSTKPQPPNPGTNASQPPPEDKPQ
jgi:rod shape-determining protein MreC